MLKQNYNLVYFMNSDYQSLFDFYNESNLVSDDFRLGLRGSLSLKTVL